MALLADIRKVKGNPSLLKLSESSLTKKKARQLKQQLEEENKRKEKEEKDFVIFAAANPMFWYRLVNLLMKRVRFLLIQVGINQKKACAKYSCSKSDSNSISLPKCG